MNKKLRKLAARYAMMLRRYLAREHEAVLEQAYELGRSAIAAGLGVLDMARVHQHALSSALRTAGDAETRMRALNAAETFFLEALSPFEVTHRGFRETNVRLQQLIATLERRNLELGRINRELAVEINERKRTEKALRESEGRLRRLFTEARRMEENLRNLSNQLLHAQEEERKHISRELHDEVGQALTAVSVNLAMLKTNGTCDPQLIRRRVADAQQLLQQTMTTVHNFARELRPTMLDELGLLPALRSCLKSFADRTGLQVHLNANPLAEKLNSNQKTVLFRIAQESLTNVARHAQASRVDVAVRKAGEGISMEVADNGKSFRPDSPNPGGGRKRLGLLGMQERVRLVNGRFSIKAEPGKGTTVRVVVPFTSSNALTAARRAHSTQTN